jgi:hypothetical protein
MSCCLLLLVPIVDGCVLGFMGTIHDEGVALALLLCSHLLCAATNFLNVFTWVEKCVGNILLESFVALGCR